MFVCCSWYMHNDIFIRGQMKSNSSALPEVCGKLVKPFKLPITEVDGYLIETNIRKFTRSLGQLCATIQTSFTVHLNEVPGRSGLIRVSDATPSADDVVLEAEPLAPLLLFMLGHMLLGRTTDSNFEKILYGSYNPAFQEHSCSKKWTSLGALLARGWALPGVWLAAQAS